MQLFILWNSFIISITKNSFIKEDKMYTEEEYEEIKKENSKLSNGLYACKIISLGVFIILVIIVALICFYLEDSNNNLECERENWYLVPRDSISLSIGAKNIQISNGLVFIGLME